MGFEVVFHYHEEVEKGEYNYEETKTKTSKVGSPYEEVSLEVLAGRIMAQLARRNILVVDVEIYEFTKKKLNYREADDGVVIKNKKFKFDDGPVVVEAAEDAEENAETQLQKLLANPAIQAALNSSGVKPHNTPAAVSPSPPPPPSTGVKKALRQEIFDPDPVLLKDAKKRGLAFTVGKKYPIYSEKIGPVGMVYEVKDDNGHNCRLADKFFLPPTAGLTGFEEPVQESQAEGQLNWNGVVEDNIPNLR
ncbi:MAG: hypothetical protein DWQ19_11125 [Crenarchaeota archaeon]|nr:MAG: hypothetical protein DWQ19_11125 [Thermoproteota archaeon]